MWNLGLVQIYVFQGEASIAATIGEQTNKDHLSMYLLKYLLLPLDPVAPKPIIYCVSLLNITQHNLHCECLLWSHMLSLTISLFNPVSIIDTLFPHKLGCTIWRKSLSKFIGVGRKRHYKSPFITWYEVWSKRSISFQCSERGVEKGIKKGIKRVLKWYLLYLLNTSLMTLPPDDQNAWLSTEVETLDMPPFPRIQNQ